MRTAFHTKLDALTARLAELCGSAGIAMDRATTALLLADLESAELVIGEHRRIAATSAQLRESAFVLLALQAPVARDLRALVSALQISADIERMGALALHVAEVARRRHPMRAVPEEVSPYFAEMGHVAVALGDSAREVLLCGDSAKAALIEREDDAMDELHSRLFGVVKNHHWKHGVAAAVDVTLLGRFYERFADHAVLIARRVIFQATGKAPDHDAPTQAPARPPPRRRSCG
jgi:phosphate transport system protein